MPMQPPQHTTPYTGKVDGPPFIFTCIIRFHNECTLARVFDAGYPHPTEAGPSSAMPTDVGASGAVRPGTTKIIYPIAIMLSNISSHVFLLFPAWVAPHCTDDDLTFTMEEFDATTAPHDVIGLSQMGGAPPPWTQDAPYVQPTPEATGRPSRVARSPERHTYSVDHVNAQRRKKKTRVVKGG